MIVFPMVGLSSRFLKAGYKIPKYMLPLKEHTVFEEVILGFSRYFNKEKFTFILREGGGYRQFIESTISTLGIRDYDIVELNLMTRGQAETVYLGLKKLNAKEDSLAIFNIDTFRQNFFFPSWISEVDGYLETFNGEGDNWSTVEYDGGVVTRVAEKTQLSEQCCTGLYYWSSIFDYFTSFEQYLDSPLEELVNGEYYVAPMYNYLIAKNKCIRFNEISKDSVVFCGTPAEYEMLLNTRYRKG